MRTIKRYANRKLYDTAEKRYMTLAHLGELVADGEKIRVLDNDSGEDITNVVLSKALSGKEKESGGFLPTELLSNLLQGGPNQLLEYLRRSWQTGAEYLKDVESEVDERIETLIDRGKLTHKEAVRFRENLLEGLRGRWQTIEKSVGEGVSSALGAIPIASRKDVDRLEKRLEELADRLGEIDAPGSNGSAGRARTSKRATRGKAGARKKKASATKKSASKKRSTKKSSSSGKKASTKKAAKRKTAKKTARKSKSTSGSRSKKAPAKKRSAKKKTSRRTKK